MGVGVTVGDAIDRIERTPRTFASVEFGLGETAEPSETIDEDYLRTTLSAYEGAFDVHLPFKQVMATPVPEINEAIVAYQRRLLEWAGSLDARKAVLHGTVRNPHDLDQRDQAAEQLEAIVAAGESVDVEVVVENVGHQRHGLQLSVLGDMARDTDTPVCFDIGHAYMEDGNGGIKRFLKRYGEQISHLHVHDVRSRGDTHLPVGAGEVDFTILQEELDNFEGTIAIEVFTDDIALLKDSLKRIEALFDF